MAYEVTNIARYGNDKKKAGGVIIRHNENKLSILIRSRLLVRIYNTGRVRTVQSATSVSDCVSDGYVKERVDRRLDTNNDFNTARSECDKSKLSYKVIRDGNGRDLATDNNTHCETERFYESERYNHLHPDVINGLSRNNNCKGVVIIRTCTNELAIRFSTSIRCNKIVVSPSLFRNKDMIAGSHTGDNHIINKNKDHGEPAFSRNAQNYCRDDRLGVGTKNVDPVTEISVRPAQILKLYGRDEGKMSYTQESDMDAENYLRSSCTVYKNSSRTARSAESTPETGSCTTIGRDKSRVRSWCKLNSNNCLSLHDILLSFNGPISEEQAWALCYQCAKCFKTALHPGLGVDASRNERLYDVTELAHVLLHKDGDVHSATIRDHIVHSDSREPFTSEHKLVFSLGLIVFRALDFELEEEEERRVAPDLEALITLMTESGDDSEVEDRLQETDDEGIERDSGESEEDPLHQTPDSHGMHPAYIRTGSPPPRARPPAPCSVNTVLQLCTRHLQGTSEQADTHYKAVIRALVAEALELSHFLEKMAADKQGNSGSSTGVTGEHHLDTLDFSDWARFWVQVIGELRRGVKLKKVEVSVGNRGSGAGTITGKRVRGSGRGIEFELTPYEILMDDIRSRRYRLKKTPSPSPHLRKDAHAVILDFIRSRPPLKKASDRKLPPLKRQSTPRELLMESIKRPPRPLRPSSSHKNTVISSPQPTTPVQNCAPDTRARNDDTVDNTEQNVTPKSSRRESTDATLAPRYQPRRLIPVDFQLDGEDDDDEDEDEDDVVTRFEDDVADWRNERDEDDVDEVDVGGQKGRAGESANPWRRTGGLRLTRNEYHRFCDTQLESYDLATQCPSRRVSCRRHTVVGPGLGVATGTLSLPHSRPQSRQRDLGSCNDATTVTKPKEQGRSELNVSSSINSSQDELTQQKSLSKGNASLGNMFLDDRLSLTLEEIVHIRSVLTKAELESLPVEGRVKEDVEKRRVCFLCLKTRFGILGPWGQRCRLCERTVCVKCYSKMRIPTEHFSHVPVVLLSPSLMLSPPSEVDIKGSSPSHGAVRSLWPRPAGGVGSAPASPASKRRDPTLRNTTPTPTLTPSLANSSRQDDEGAVCTSLPPINSSPAASSGPILDKSRRFYCSSANSSPARTSASSSRYGASDLRVAERLRGVAMVVCHDCRIMVLQIIKSSRTTRATIRNNAISRLTLNLSPIYV